MLENKINKRIKKSNNNIADVVVGDGNDEYELVELAAWAAEASFLLLW